jgi:TonB family protein
MLLFLVIAALPPEAHAMDEFWIGYDYSVGVIFKVDSPPNTKPPNLLKLSMPSYPINLFRAGVAGKINVKFVVNDDGRISKFEVLHSDFREFVDDVKATVEGWIFSPGINRINGNRIAEPMECQFIFSISGNK